ncbi:MAG: hypothetical protein R3Y63_12235 [Eubacteriales bacterium]
MKLAISLLLCLVLFSFEKETSKTESTSYSVDVGSFDDYQELGIYQFENFDNNAKEQTATTFFRRIASDEELILFMETLSEDNNVCENSFLKVEEKLSHLDMNFFEESDFIVTLLNTYTTPYYYDFEDVTVKDGSIMVRPKISGDGSGEEYQSTLVYIETEQFSNDLAIKISKVYD